MRFTSRSTTPGCSPSGAATAVAPQSARRSWNSPGANRYDAMNTRRLPAHATVPPRHRPGAFPSRRSRHARVRHAAPTAVRRSRMSWRARGSDEPAAAITTASPGRHPTSRSRSRITTARAGSGPSAGRTDTSVCPLSAIRAGRSAWTWYPDARNAGTTTAGSADWASTSAGPGPRTSTNARSQRPDSARHRCAQVVDHLHAGGAAGAVRDQDQHSAGSIANR